MPIAEIQYQPNTAQLLAAYRPVRFRISASNDNGAIPPFVSCDIYLDDLFHKTIVRTAYESTSFSATVFEFDIANALQEYLQPDIAAIDNRNVLAAKHMSAKVFCKFRSSKLDTDGFTVDETVKPIQGTKFDPPISGTGLVSNTFFVINATLQHEDNQNLASHLSNFKQGGWSGDAFPLSHRKKYFFCPGDSDHYPVIYRGDCLAADLVLNYRLKGSATVHQITAQDFNTCATINYSFVITGNKLDVTLTTAPPENESVIVEYKRTTDTLWKSAGQYFQQHFSFYVSGTNVAGNYNVRVIHFCSSCLHSDPIVKNFTLDGSVSNTEWRGINPFCVQQTLDPVVYIALEIRNPVTDLDYLPNDDLKQVGRTVTTGDLYAKFYSDAALLHPYNLLFDNLKVAVKKNEKTTQNHDLDSMIIYTVDVSGTEVFLENVITHGHVEVFQPYPTVISTIDSDETFTPFPGSTVSPVQTGELGYHDIQEFNLGTGTPTGQTKANDPDDQDYVAPEASSICSETINYTTVKYGAGLNIMKVEFALVIGFTYATTVANTYAGDYQYILSLPRNSNIKISVKAAPVSTLPGDSGTCKVSVTYINTAGVSVTTSYLVTNNVESALPATFRNITNVTIIKN